MPGQGYHALRQRHRVLLAQRFTLPLAHWLMFYSHPGGVADEPIGVIQVRPGRFQSARLAILVVGFQLRSDLMRFGRHGFFVGGQHHLRFFSVVVHPVEVRVESPSAGHEVHGSVRADHAISERQGHARYKFFLLAGVGGAVGLQMNGVDDAKAPVEGKQGIPVRTGKFAFRPVQHSGGRALSDVEHGGQVVGIGGRPLGVAAPPAELRPAGHVADAGRAVPGHAQVPLHVRVEGEHIARWVEGNVEGIAKPTGHHLPALAQRVDVSDPPAGSGAVVGVAAGIQDFGEQVVVFPDPGQPVGVHLGQVGVVTGDHVERLPVGSQHDAVWPVLAETFQLLEQGNPVELIVVVGVLQAIQPASPIKILFFIVQVVVHHHVQAVKSPQQPLGVTHLDDGVGNRRFVLNLQPLDHRSQRVGANGSQVHPVQRSVLIGGDQPPLVIEGHRHPRTHLVVRGTVQMLRPEAGL